MRNMRNYYPGAVRFAAVQLLALPRDVSLGTEGQRYVQRRD